VNGNYSWLLAGGPVDIMDGPNVLATITSASVGYKNYNPAFPVGVQDLKSVEVAFTVTAGASDTSFIVTSGLSSFANLFPGELRATSGMTLTDSAGSPGGATIYGDQPGGAYFSTFYNAVGGVPATGTTFADLLSVGGSQSVGVNGSTSWSEDYPVTPGTFDPVGVAIGSLSSQWAFTLTQGDQSGTSSAFFAIPAPASVTLVGVGLMGLRRRR